MRVRAATTAADVFANPDLYSAVTEQIAACVADMQDNTKDPKFKRHIKIDLIFSQDASGDYQLAATVAPVLSPTCCAMPNAKQATIDDYDPKTGEFKS